MKNSSTKTPAALGEPAADPEAGQHEDGPSPGRPSQRPALEVVPKATRRRFSAEYKQRILAEAEECRDRPGGIGALLRREGLYSSHLIEWRKAAKSGALAELGKKRGRKPKQDPTKKELEKLERRNARLEEELRKAKIIIDVQKKVAALLGNPIEPLDPSLKLEDEP